MRIVQDDTSRTIYFVALDPVTGDREGTLTGVTGCYSKDGGTATVFTPTLTDLGANMEGVFACDIDVAGMVSMSAGIDSLALCVHIEANEMLPVTREIEVYREKITEGNTLDVTATGAAGIDWGNVENPTTAVDLSGTDIQLCDTVTTLTGHTAQTADHTAGIADIPTVAEFNARTLVAASYFDPATDTVVNVTNVAAISAGGITAASFGAGAIDDAAIDATAGAEIADALLGRNIAGGSDGGRDVTSALRRIRNRVRNNAGTLEVYQENDSTIDWSAAATTAAGNPISEIDPT